MDVFRIGGSDVNEIRLYWKISFKSKANLRIDFTKRKSNTFKVSVYRITGIIHY